MSRKEEKRVLAERHIDRKFSFDAVFVSTVAGNINFKLLQKKVLLSLENPFCSILKKGMVQPLSTSLLENSTVLPNLAIITSEALVDGQ